MLNHNTDATVIDGKHVHITGNTYSLLNDAGIVIGYEKRVQNDDGTFSWVFTDMPSVSDIGQGFTLGDDVSLQSPNLDTSSLDAMAQQMAEANSAAANGTGDTYNITINNNSGGSANDMIEGAQNNPPQNQVIQNADGTHTEIQTIRETKTIDGYTTTYETLVKKTYDSSGNLINSFQEGPYEVSKEQSITQETEGAPNPDAKEATLSGKLPEYAAAEFYDRYCKPSSSRSERCQSWENRTLHIIRDGNSYADLRSLELQTCAVTIRRILTFPPMDGFHPCWNFMAYQVRRLGKPYGRQL